MSDWMIRESSLDNTQKEILNMGISTSCTIIGCAGSGKSLLALHKAKKIQERQHTCVVIVFTRALKEFFAGGVVDLALQSGTVKTYASWSKRPVDYIIVDEAQDFSAQEIRYIKSCAKLGVYFFGDDAQQIYKNMRDRNVISSMDEVANVTSTSIMNLQINHRLTKEVAAVAEYLNTGNSIHASCYKKGEKPYLIKINPFEPEVEYISNVIKNHNLTDVAIFLPTNDMVTEYQQMFANINFKVEINTNESRQLNFNNNCPKIMTYHSAKGLQFDTVFMPNIDALKDYNKTSTYVAMTRSSNNLYLFSSTGRPNILSQAPNSLFNIPSDLIDFDF